MKQIIQDHAINYSTLRHVLIQYYLFGRTDIRKFRPSKSELERFAMARIQKKESQAAKSPSNTQSNTDEIDGDGERSGSTTGSTTPQTTGVKDYLQYSPAVTLC